MVDIVTGLNPEYRKKLLKEVKVLRMLKYQKVHIKCLMEL